MGLGDGLLVGEAVAIGGGGGAWRWRWSQSQSRWRSRSPMGVGVGTGSLGVGGPIGPLWSGHVPSRRISRARPRVTPFVRTRILSRRIEQSAIARRPRRLSFRRTARRSLERIRTVRLNAT